MAEIHVFLSKTNWNKSWNCLTCLLSFPDSAWISSNPKETKASASVALFHFVSLLWWELTTSINFLPSFLSFFLASFLAYLLSFPNRRGISFNPKEIKAAAFVALFALAELITSPFYISFLAFLTFLPYLPFILRIIQTDKRATLIATMFGLPRHYH